jgi:hypothetical protein
MTNSNEAPQSKPTEKKGRFSNELFDLLTLVVLVVFALGMAVIYR